MNSNTLMVRVLVMVKLHDVKFLSCYELSNHSMEVLTLSGCCWPVCITREVCRGLQHCKSDRS